RAAGGVLGVADSAPPPPPPGRLPGRAPVKHQRPQVLPDAVDRLARHRHIDVPDSDPGAAGPVDDEAGQAGAQRSEDMALLFVTPGARTQQETSVEGSEQAP